MSAQTSWKREGDIDVLYLGEIPVGRVHQSRWIFNLKYPACFWKPEKTEARARDAVQFALNDWLLRAGLPQTEIQL